MAFSTDIPSWPPKSPYEVLLLTPKKDRQQVPGSPSPMVTDDRTPQHNNNNHHQRHHSYPNNNNNNNNNTPFHHNYRGPPSPSPRTQRTPMNGRGVHHAFEPEDTDMLGGTDVDDDDIDLDAEEEEEEDEETLRLKLARIEAKLRLKQLQRKRKRAGSVSDQVGFGNNNDIIGRVGTPKIKSLQGNLAINNTPGLTSSTPNISRTSSSASVRKAYNRAITPPPQVQVAGSPVKQPPPSPSRVLLGLDRGLRAKDVSLRRPPNLRFGSASGPSGVVGGTSRPGTSTSTNSSSTYVSDVFSSRPTTTSTATSNPSITFGARDPSPTRPVVKSFNQRIVEARQAENEKKAKQAAIDGSRSKGFGLTEEERMECEAAAAAAAAQGTLSSLEATRLGVDAPKASIWGAPPSTSFSGGGGSSSNGNGMGSTGGKLDMSASFDATKSISFDTVKSINPGSSTGGSETNTGAGYDSYSHLHLSNRILPHTTLSRALQQKTIYLLPDLLKTVISPSYDPPDTEGDWVVMGIISSKSEPRQTTKAATNSKTNEKNPAGDKYMVMTLTDLKWDIELFLFGGGFEKFWKVGVGTVVAILNPGILRPRNADSGRFSLTLNSKEDTVLEVGIARDLGFCKSVKRDGKKCNAWVDRRRMEFCSWHVEMAVKKASNSRMELNNTGKLFSPPRKGSLRPTSRFLGRGAGGGGGGGRFTAGGGGGSGSFKDDGLLPEGPLPDLPQRVGGAGGKVFVYPSRGTNALFDDSFSDAFHNGTREDRMKKQLAKSEREREVAKKLVAAQRSVGGGLASTGAEYLRIALEEEERRKAREVAAGGSGKDVAGAGNGSGSGSAGGATVGGGLRGQFVGAADGIVESLGPTMKSLGLSKGRIARNTEDYSTLTNRTTANSTIHLSPIKRRKNYNRPGVGAARPSAPALVLQQQEAEAEMGPVKKRPRVHFNRPVVTGGEILRDGKGGVGGVGGVGGIGGGGAGAAQIETDDDDDLEIM